MSEAVLLVGPHPKVGWPSDHARYQVWIADARHFAAQGINRPSMRWNIGV